MIPSIQACFDLMAEYRMLDNIRAHSLLVAKVARLIAQGLYDTGVDIDVKKVIAAALLHDIGKTPALKWGGDHAVMGADICRNHHLDEIAPIVLEHVRLRHYDLNGTYSEKEVVYYSDKRVNHDQIVGLDDRLAYILNRYGTKGSRLNQAIRANFGLCKQVQAKLFKKLNFTPEALAQEAANAGEIPA
ncbi:MAG: HD domain-containing protein [Deltaproteobacteria bacterium]|nr:HD domain-containing protein [Deltaproteobacteria bacterium]